MSRRLLFAALVLFLVAALVWALWPKPVTVETAIIGHRDITVSVEDEGKTRIREVFVVSAPIAGELSRIGLHAGDSVIAGKTVVSSLRPVAPSLLDARSNRMAQFAIEAATAAVSLAQAQTVQADAQLAFANRDLARIEPLVRSGVVSEKAHDQAMLNQATAATELERAKANVTMQKQQLESARAALIQTGSASTDASCCVEVKAPVTGKVLRVVNESAGVVPAGAPLLEIGDPAGLEITVDLLSRDAVRVQVGAAATIEGWGGPGLAATVDRIDPAAVTKISALGIEEQRVNAVLRLTGKPEEYMQLGHGFRVVARITVWHGKNLVAAPISALFRSPNGWSVFIIEQGRARLRNIELGQRNTEYAEVKSGLTQGDTVILHPGDSLADGQRIATLQVENGS